MRRTASAAAALVAATLALAGCSAGTAPTAASVGYVDAGGSGVTEWTGDDRPQAPELAGTDMAGNAVTTADWAGSVIVVNFWYAGCPPCRAEAPILAAAANDNPDVHFLGINSVDEPATAQAFEANFDMPYPTLQDSDVTLTALLSGIVPLSAFPTTIVIDTEGRISARVIGEIDASTLRTLIGAAS